MYEYEWKCTWGSADPMGIAYYPRLIDANHQAGEEFMDEHGVAYWDIPDDLGIHLPLVAQGTEFKKPVEVADVLTITVTPELGNKSLRLEFEATHEDGAPAFEGYEQHVAVSIETDKSVELPDELREALSSDDE
mgnify:CR=1 FL=1